MRDLVLSATAGFVAACTGGFAVHRALWKTADAQAQRIETLSGKPGSAYPGSVAAKPRETFEQFIGGKAVRWWNSGVDNVHRRLLGLPQTMGKIVEDVSERRVAGAGSGGELDDKGEGEGMNAAGEVKGEAESKGDGGAASE